MAKILESRDIVLDKQQLMENLAKMASDNEIVKNSDGTTYPVPRAEQNCKYIYLVYTLLSEHVKMGIPIHPAGEWILDNYYLIEKSTKSISKELSKHKYMKFPGVLKNGFARIYELANEIVSNTDGQIKTDELIEYLNAYQTQKYLTMDEIWNLGIFLQICIIEKIRKICEKIFITQIQKHNALNMVERLIENKPKRKIKITSQSKYSFIEFMSYKLKKYGKIAIPYLEALENQVKQSGMTLTEVINREHFDIAVRTVSMKNSITSIKKIQMLNIVSVFEQVNVVENTLKKDPANVYEKMDIKTKAYYRGKIQELSKKSKLSEIFIAEQILKLCEEKEQGKQSHVGYYIIDDGRQELVEKLLGRKTHITTPKENANKYIFTIYFFTIITTLILYQYLKLYSLLLFIPIQNTWTQILQFISSKIRPTRLIPKLDYESGIPEKSATMCIIPTIIKSSDDVEKNMKKLEVYYLANKSENLYFTLLGDCTSSNKEIERFDQGIEIAGKRITEELNSKYGNKFSFIYRRRTWSNDEKCFMGWERKRGLICQFNEYLKTGKGDFAVNTFAEIPQVKYIITLDSDTNLTLNSAFQLVGAMSHILNEPEIDRVKNIVVKGHGLIQPRIGLEIEDGRKSVFSRLFAGNGGTDLYTNAISDVYQDNFEEGIFTGKGIYDLDAFYKVLKNEIPENTVLSHDLLEGSYLRCGLASDIVLMDGYPSKYSAYKARMHRWIRGDVQIIGWLKSKLNTLSKYKIIDNLMRNKNEEYILISIIALALAKPKFLFIPLIIYSLPTLILLVDNIINQKSGTFKSKLFVETFSKWTHIIYKFLTELLIIPDIAFLQISAFATALYRMKISHQKLLEWTTSDEVEKNSKNSVNSYIKSMMGQEIVAVGLLIIFILNIGAMKMCSSAILISLASMWLFAPIIMWGISQSYSKKIKIDKKDKKYLTKIANRTWKYFKENMINNLPADNYQEGRKEVVAKRTSPTNIGLGMLSAIASYDLEIETLDYTIDLLQKMTQSVEKLQKWNGHLYNWYNIEKMEPLHPYDISSVDSGNFVGYLYTTKQFLEEHKDKNCKANGLISQIDNIINSTDFSKLYNYENGLFSIGYSVENNKLYDSYYDLLASEARQTSLVAIAKKDVSPKHWNNLGRTLTRIRNHKGLISWGGTAFEYLMPNVNIPTYPSTMLDESCKLLVLSNKEYAQKLHTPWGISEAAYSLKDFYGNYQYKTFGVPWLGLKRGLDDDVVISPYSSALALPISYRDAINNLRLLQKERMLGKYGFYDSIDYKPKKEVVKTFMAHHQGMILTSIDNAINNNIMQTRFMNNPEIQGIKILLQEKMPEDVIITKEKRAKAQKIKYTGYEKSISRNKGVNLISSNHVTNLSFEDGRSITKFGDVTINEDVNIYVKNINTNKIYDFNNIIKNKEEGYSLQYSPYSSRMKIEDGNIKVTVKTAIIPNSHIEVRKIKIDNKGINEANVELTTCTEPILAHERDHYAHPTFSKMFLRYENINQNIAVWRKSRREGEQTTCLATTLYSEDGGLEFEIDKEKFTSRGNYGIPDIVQNSKPLTNKIQTVINPIIAFKKTLNIPAGEYKEMYLISSIGTDKKQAISELERYKNKQKLNRVYELAREQTEAETRYMGITEKEASTYQKMLKYMLYSKQKAFEQSNELMSKLPSIDLSNKNLWKYGISGDFPLLLLNIKEKNDIDSIGEIIKAYEYYKSKEFWIEIVIICNTEIKNQIMDEKIMNYLNQRGGIFVLEGLRYDEIKMLQARANLSINPRNGTLEVQIKELEKEKNIAKNVENIEYENLEQSKPTKLITTKYEELNYENEYGSFDDTTNEYWIKSQTPVAWANIMANEKWGSVVTNSMGGFTWYVNSQTNRITRFTNDAYLDKSSEKITICGHEKYNEKFVGYGLGYTQFATKADDLETNLTIYVPEKDSVKISILQVKNIAQNEQKLDIKYDVDFQMGENKNNSIIVENLNKGINTILANNLMNNEYVCYITSNAKLDKNKEVHITIPAGEEREIVFILGAEKNELECVEKATKYLSSYIKEFENTKKYWKEKTTKVTSNTPMDSFDKMQNGRLVYQTIVSRMYGRTGFYQSSGGYGFRDQLQDSIGMRWIDPQILKQQILLHARHQFQEGDVEHWWHEDSGLGIRTRYSDDLLWLVYALEEYIDFTGDYDILNETQPYVKAEILEENEVDRVNYFEISQNEGTIFEHCYRALMHTIDLGEHNLPFMKHGDWNDGMNKIGERGKGESVWLGFFMCNVLTRFIELIDYTEKNSRETIISKDMQVEMAEQGEQKVEPTSIEKIDYTHLKDDIQNTASKIRNALNTVAWDGHWYIRAFDDNGEKIGSISNSECKIDSISQSFAVLTDAGDNDKKYIAMASLENYLVDNENNLVKLLTPALDKTNLGYISSYAKGMRENGGQYTHVCCC